MVGKSLLWNARFAEGNMIVLKIFVILVRQRDWILPVKLVGMKFLLLS